MHRVLIVDDSPTSRAVLAGILTEEAGFEVIGYAHNGQEAITKAKELEPDVITMDINMPIMDGLDATKEIMIESPTPIVIVSASSRAQEVETTMQALRAGALTVIMKPTGPNAPNFDAMSKEIVDTVGAMAKVFVIRHRRRLKPAASPASQADTTAAAIPKVPTGKIQVIGVVASTGGPPALAKLLGQLPADFPVPLLLVQHIVPSFVNGFANWLNSVTPLTVKLAVDQERVENGTVYVAPQDMHMGVTRSRRIRLSDEPAIGGFRPAGTHLFSSLAENLGQNAAGVILTGMGQDGFDGLQKMHANGAPTIAQDESSCVVYGMPRVAVEGGVIDSVLPLDQIAAALVQLACVET
ncbi:MAG: chemotaxis response regulator protein-glutamate methylesterase [Pirellulaceae bacterium]|nr:chemotaxis response regulator protein-glutamate methylesterase [Pirellulaceae bacterium]